MTNRRNFIKKTSGLAASLGIAGIPFSELYARRRKVAPSDTVKIGLMGVRGVNWANLQSHLRVNGVECIALCDIDQTVLNNRAADLEKMTGKKADLYSDFRKMLERKDIDAILVGTPDHWHTLGTLYAMESGKDVYVEKPGSHNIFEGRKMVEAAQKYDRIVQHGVQLRSSVAIQEAIKHLRDGLIGNVYMARGLVFRWRADIGKKGTENNVDFRPNDDIGRKALQILYE